MIETCKLYQDTVELNFNPDKHTYTVDGEIIPSVTGILSVAISKPGLINWSAQMAADYVRERLKPGIGLDEMQIKELCDFAKLAHRQKKDSAADVGTAVHQFCEDWIKGKNPELPINQSLRNSCEAFLGWATKHDLKFDMSERKIFSKRYKYAGTCDAVGTVDGVMTVLDFKTNTACYPEMGLQLAAYQQALSEELPNLKIENRIIVRIGKDGELEVKSYPNYERDLNAFSACLEIQKWASLNKEETYAKTIRV